MTVSGVGALNRDLGDLAEAIADTSTPDRQTAALIAREARPRALRRTGHMAGSITPTNNGVNVHAEYAPVVSVRWNNPFLRQGLDAAWPAIEAAYGAHLEDALRSTIRPSY